MMTVKLKDVTKTFGDVTAVDNLSFSVSQGSIYGLAFISIEKVRKSFNLLHLPLVRLNL
ncbi:MAG: hypothetical protein JXB48_19155 [Candidatus Latescibacteria bacterium]|nr:hypothetical protein [Candidatus Latescibacterota bacterium]